MSVSCRALCCKVEVSAADHSSIGVQPSVVCLIARNRDSLIMKRSWPARDYPATGEQNYLLRLRLQQG